MKQIRFRITGNWSNACSVLFYGTEERTVILNSKNIEVFEMKGSAFKLYEDLLSVQDDDYNTMELLTI